LLIPNPAVARRYGVTLRTIHRWDNDPALGFPKPININGRLYRDSDELDAFDRQRAAARDKMPEVA
jgi:hypothetical protein